MTTILAVVGWLSTYLLHSTLFLGGSLVLAAAGLVRSQVSRDLLWKLALVGAFLTSAAQLGVQFAPLGGRLALRTDARNSIAGESAVAAAPAVEIARAERSVVAPPWKQPGLARAETSDAVGMPDAPAALTDWTSADWLAAWPTLLVAVWGIVAAALLLRLGLMRRRLAQALRDRRPLSAGPLADLHAELCAAAGLRAPVRLSVTSRVSGPITLGREIVVPERVVTHLGRGEQRAVLAHELAHVRRRDGGWLMLALILEALLFFQPLNRVVRRRMQETAEYLCDDLAAGQAGGAALARCLAVVAGWMRPGATGPATAPGMAQQRSQLLSRVARLVEGGGTVAGASRTARALAAAFAVIAVAALAPSVAALDSTEQPVEVAATPEPAGILTSASSGDGWGSLRQGGRLIVLTEGYAVRLRGRGRIGFRSWGRMITVADGYRVEVGGAAVRHDMELCESHGTVRLVGPGGAAWELIPVQLPRHQRRALAVRRMRVDTVPAADVEAALGIDLALDGQLNVAIDTLVRIWAGNPEAVRRAALRLASSYEREMRPAIESLGVALLADLVPRFELAGRTVAKALRR